MWFILSILFERTVRFVATVNVVLEGYNSCLPNNKWLGDKHVSLVFGYTNFKGALLMISSTLNNTISSSAKWLQNPPALRFKSTFDIFMCNTETKSWYAIYKMKNKVLQTLCTAKSRQNYIYKYIPLLLILNSKIFFQKSFWSMLSILKQYIKCT